MKLVKFRAENFKNIKVFEYDFSGKRVVKLTGKNEAGKSSVLDAIQYHFDRAFRRALESPIRRGEEKAHLTVETDKWVSKMRITRKANSVTVESLDGTTEFKDPAKILDAVHGEFSFDVSGFLQTVKTDKQKTRDMLLKLSGLGPALASIKERRATIYEERTVNNREVTKMQGALAAMVGLYPDVGDQEVSLQELLAVQADLEHAKEQYEAHQQAIRQATRHYEEMLAQIDFTKSQINELQQQLELHEQHAIERAEYVSTLKEKEIKPVTEEQLQGIRDRMIAREDENVKVRHNRDYQETAITLESLKRDSETLTGQLHELEQEKTALIQNANYPLAGLSVDESEVSYHGVPLSQVSTGTAIRIGAHIEMALKPALEFLLIRNASLLDSEGHEMIESIAAEHDYLVIMEENDESGKVGLFLVDGEVKVDNTGPSPQVATA